MGVMGVETGALSWIWNLETVAPPSHQPHYTNPSASSLKPTYLRQQAVETPQTHPEMVEALGCACRVSFVITLLVVAIPILPDCLGAFESLGHTPSVRIGSKLKNAGDLRCEVAYLGSMGAKVARARNLFPAAASGRDSASRNRPTKHRHRGLRVFSRQVLLGRNLPLAHQVAGALRNSAPS